jgi:hypothetical protein
MADEKVPEQTLSDAEITEVKQPRRKFLLMGMAAAGLVGAAMTTTSCGSDHCDNDDGTDSDPGDPVGGGRFDRCDNDSN